MHTKLHERARQRGVDLSLAILLLSASMQILLWARLNLRYQYIFDYDASKLFYHIICMWREKTLLIPDWIYVSTGEWDCASFLALPFYGLTGNIKLSFGLANTINVLLFALVISRLFKAVPVEHGRYKGMLLAVCVVLMPYCWGMLDYANMLFYGAAQYVYKVLLPIWLVTLYVGAPQRRLTSTLYTAAFLILAWATATSSGLYVMLCGLFPILCCRFIRALSIGRERLNRRDLFITFSTIAIFIAGFAFQKAVHLTTKTESMLLIPINTLLPHISQIVDDFLRVTRILHKENWLPIFSLDAIVCYGKIAILAVMCLMGLRELPHCFLLKTGFSAPEQMMDDERFAGAALGSIFIWNLSVLLLVESSPRYHLIGYIPLMLLSCMALSKTLEACPLKPLKKFLWLAASCLVILLAALLFFQARTVVNHDKELRCQLIIEEAERQDIQTIVVLDDGWLVEETRPLDPDRDYVTYFSSDQKISNCDVPSSLNDMSLLLKPHMLVTQDRYPFDLLPEDMQAQYTLIKDEWNHQYYIARPAEQAGI